MYLSLITAMYLVVGGCSTSEPAEREETAAESQQKQARQSAEGEDADDKRHDHHGEKHGGDQADHQQKRFVDPEKRAEEWNDPARDEWQKPEAIIEAMDIEQGMTVADVGAGTGYFLPFLSEAVGEEGRVVAADIEEAMLEYIENLAAEKGLENIETVKSEKTDSNLEEASVDRILIVNTWHHIPDRGEYARHLRERLTEGGEVWIVDFQRDSPDGPPKKHRLEPSEIVDELEQGGLEAEVHPLELDRQYIVVGKAKG
jgi:SAM-dependent methyltransferase